MYIPYQDVAANLGLKSDDTLLLASDISKLAFTALKNKEKFSGNLLLDSFIQVLKEGTFAVPGYIDSFVAGDTFDKLKSAPEMGALSKLAFERGDFLRSNDPLHSFLAVGTLAERISKMDCESTFGEDSVFSLLHNVKAKMLLIDLDLKHGFTFAHYVEEQEQVHYRKYVNLNYKNVKQPGIIEDKMLKVYSKKKGVVNTLNKLEPMLIENGAMEKIEINNSVFRLVQLNEAYRVISEEIEMNNAENLHSFDTKLYFKSIAKSILKK